MIGDLFKRVYYVGEGQLAVAEDNIRSPVMMATGKRCTLTGLRGQENISLLHVSNEEDWNEALNIVKEKKGLDGFTDAVHITQATGYEFPDEYKQELDIERLETDGYEYVSLGATTEGFFDPDMRPTYGGTVTHDEGPSIADISDSRIESVLYHYFPEARHS